jgi:hypothetical protein
LVACRFGVSVGHRRCSCDPLTQNDAGTTAASRTTRFLPRRPSRSLSLSQVWRTNEGHRKAHRCRNPTSLSTAGHGCGMKRFFLTRNCLASQNAPDFYASPRNRSLLAASSTTLSGVPFCGSRLLRPRRHEWLSELHPRRTSTPLFHAIEFA